MGETEGRREDLNSASEGVSQEVIKEDLWMEGLWFKSLKPGSGT